MNLNQKLHFKVISYGTNNYKRAVSLRENILRKPLGLSFSSEELELEKNHVHIAGFLEHKLCATAVLVPERNTLKMQRVAIRNDLQGIGIGSKLLEFCEYYAHTHGFQKIYCSARNTAISFYLKNEYSIEGVPYEEDGIPHQKMYKFIKVSN